MKVTIITVCLNSEKTIKRTIESILSQTYRPLEYIIIDGLSKDKTLEIAKNYIEKFKNADIEYKIFSEKDNGIYDAMNKGIKLATGDWINFLNSGDTFVDIHTLEKIFNNNDVKNYDILCGSWYYKKGNKLKYYRINRSWKIEEGMPACHQSIFVKTSIHKLFLFDTKYKIASDYDFLFKVIFKGYNRIKFFNFPFVNYESGGYSEVNSSLCAIEYIEIYYKYTSNFTGLYNNVGFKTFKEKLEEEDKVKIYTQNEEILLRKALNFFKTFIKKINKKINDRKIIIYGAGDYLKYIISFLHIDRKSVLIVDDNKQKIGQKIEEEILIHSSEVIKYKNFDLILITIHPRYFKQIKKKLIKQYNCPRDKIIYGYSKYVEYIRVFQNKGER